MPRPPHVKIINIPPNLREKVLEQNMEVIYGREIPDLATGGKNPFFFYMFNLSQIFLVARSVNSINKLENTVQKLVFSSDGERR